MTKYYYLNFDDLSIQTYQTNLDPLFLFKTKKMANQYRQAYLKLKAHQRINYYYNHQTIPKTWYQIAIQEYVKNSDLTSHLTIQTIQYQHFNEPNINHQLTNYHFVLNPDDQTPFQYLQYMYTKLANETHIVLQ